MVTINSGTVVNVVVGLAGVRVGTANTHPTTSGDVGYTEDGCQIEYTPEVQDIMVAEENNPILNILISEEIKFTLAFAESTIANMGYAMMGGDSTTVTKQITFGANSAKFQAIVIEGEAPGGNSGIRQILAQKVGAIGTVTQAYKKGEKVLTPVEYKAFTPTLGPTVQIADMWDFTVASGAVATYTTAKNSMRLTGQGGAADDLDTVTPASGTPTVGDKLILRCADASAAVTVKDDGGTPGTGTFAMSDNTDYVLDDLRKWIEFSHDSTNQWVETQRGPAYA